MQPGFDCVAKKWESTAARGSIQSARTPAVMSLGSIKYDAMGEL